MSAPTAAEIETRLFGTDVAFPGGDGTVRVTPSGDWPLVTGRANLRAAQQRRAQTMPGEILFRPQYGGGLPKYVEAIASPQTRSQLAIALRTNAIRDRRIQDARVAVKAGDGTLEIEMTLQPRGQPEIETVEFDAQP